MSSSWVCGLLFLGSLLLLDQATQGTAQFPGFPNSAQGFMSMMQQQQLAQLHNMLRRQAIKAHQRAINHLNKKFNTTYRKAPGETTHIMVEHRSIRCYHINTVLVNANCPGNHTGSNLKDCEISPQSPKMECNILVYEISDSEYLYTGEGCHEFKGRPRPTIGPANLSEEKAEIAYQ